MVFFCLGDCGGFWDAVEEVSVLMNGNVEKRKIKKRENIPFFVISFVILLGSRLQKKNGAQELMHGAVELNLTYPNSVHKWKSGEKKAT